MATTNNFKIYASTGTNFLSRSESYTNYLKGAIASEPISSKIVNTALLTGTKVAKSLIDALSRSQSYGTIDHTTPDTILTNYIRDGLVQTKVNAATTSDKWSSSIKITIADATQAHSGSENNMDGHENILLLLPETITASLDGNAKTATTATRATACSISTVNWAGQNAVSGGITITGMQPMSSLQVIYNTTVGSTPHRIEFPLISSFQSSNSGKYTASSVASNGTVYLAELTWGTFNLRIFAINLNSSSSIEVTSGLINYRVLQ